MYIQENSKTIRRYIHPVTYFKLQQEQELKSLIYWDLCSNNFIYSKERIFKRILELETLEQQGFVFIGEKNWLQDCLASNFDESFGTYEQWVRYNFDNFLKLKFTKTKGRDNDMYRENYQSTLGFVWHSELSFENNLLNFQQLTSYSYNYCNKLLNLYVGGNDRQPLTNYLCKLFEILHNFEYYVQMLPEIASYEGEMSINDVFVEHPVNADFWSINAISEYGADMEAEFYRNNRIYFPY